MRHEDGWFFWLPAKNSVSRGNSQQLNGISHVPSQYSECKRGAQRIDITHCWGDSWVYSIQLIKSCWSQMLLYCNWWFNRNSPYFTWPSNFLLQKNIQYFKRIARCHAAILVADSCREVLRTTWSYILYNSGNHGCHAFIACKLATQT